MCIHRKINKKKIEENLLEVTMFSALNTVLVSN